MAVHLRQRAKAAEGTVLTGAKANKDAGLAIDQALLHQPGPFQCLPTRLQEQAMLRVHAKGFTRGNAKEERIELFDIINKGPRAHIHLTGRGPLRIVKFVDIPAAEGHLLHHVHPRGQQLPEGFGGIGPREATGHADHRDGFVQANCPILNWAVYRHRQRRVWCVGQARRDQIEQVSSQLIDRRVFKGNRGRQFTGEAMF